MDLHVIGTVTVNVILAVLCERKFVVEVSAGDLYVNRNIGIFRNAYVDSAGAAVDIGSCGSLVETDRGMTA